MSGLRGPPILILSTLLVGACARESPTAPDASGETPPMPMVALASDGIAMIRTAVADATTRLLPALGDGNAARALNGPLSGLGEALGAGDTGAAAHRLRHAVAALDAAETAAGADSPLAADLAAIRLVLDTATGLLSGGAVPGHAGTPVDRRSDSDIQQWRAR